MRFHFFNRGNTENQRNDPSPNTNVGRLRQEGEELLAAGDQAIGKALSQDSVRFLRETRQQGGQ